MTSPLAARRQSPPTSGPALRALRPSRRLLALLTFGALILAAVLIATQGFFWFRAVQLRGGADVYARGLDFTATLTGALIVSQGHGADLYGLETQRAAQVAVMAPALSLRDGALLPYIHPPFEALVFAPLMALPYGVLYWLWTAGMLAAYAGSLALLWRAAPLQGRGLWLTLALICSYSPFHQALWLGQSTPLVFLGLCGAYAGLRSRHEPLAGAALSLVALKPQMLIAVGVVLLFGRRWRVLGSCAAVLGAVVVAAMPVLGPRWPLRYVDFLASMSRWSGQHFEYPYAMYNWRGFVTNAVGPWSAELVLPATTLLTLVVAGALVWACWRGRATVARSPFTGTDDLRWAAACLAGVLIAPHLYVHDLLLLALPAWIVAARLIARGGPAAPGWVALLGVGYALGLFALVRTEAQLGASIILTVGLIALALALLLRESLAGSGARATVEIAGHQPYAASARQ